MNLEMNLEMNIEMNYHITRVLKGVLIHIFLVLIVAIWFVQRSMNYIADFETHQKRCQIN